MHAFNAVGLLSTPAMRRTFASAKRNAVLEDGSRCACIPSPHFHARGTQRTLNRSQSHRTPWKVVSITAQSTSTSHSDSQGADSCRTCRPAGLFAASLAAFRAVMFYITTFIFATPLFGVMLFVFPYVMLFDKYRRRAEHAINTWWAKLTTSLFYRVNVKGLENLPPSDQPAVYVANHQSFLDIYTLFHLHRDFKFISKTSNFLIPIIGWSMFMTGHVMINRVDRRSQLECLKQCVKLLKSGTSVLFFPEGTRSKDGRLQSFKKGAFTVAAKAKVPVVPITLVGTGDLMPNAREFFLFPGTVTMIIHPSVAPMDVDNMTSGAYAAISSSLPPELVAPVHET